jgi:serine/threonine protein kinase
VTDERWQLTYAIYEAAASLADAERQQYVHTAAPDAEIASKVLAMLDEMEATANSGVFPEPAYSEDPAAASVPCMVLSPGATIGSYQVLERLGSGGMGEVYLAYDPHLDRRVAIKLLPAHLAADAVARERLRREALAAAALDHPFICKIFEIGEDKGTLFIVMEYISGETLYSRLRGGLLPRSQALRIAAEVAEALEEAHAKPLVHRDLKPANVMLTSQSRAKVMDFGLAKKPASDKLKDTGVTAGDLPLTAAGAVAGTPEYMSPEQMTGAPLDHRSDLFSFGIILCELLTGKHPFQRNSKLETLTAILRDPPDLAVTGNAGLSPGEIVLIRRLLAKSPEERYQSMREVCDDLARLASSSAVAAEPEEASTPSIGRDLSYQSASGIGADLKRLNRAADSGRRAGVSPGVPGASRPRQETEHGQDALATTGDKLAPRRWLLWLPGSLAVIVAGLATAWLLLRRPPQPLGELTQKCLTFNSSQNPVVSNAISPDGKYLAYSDPAGIHVKLISTGEERLIPRPAGVPADAEWHVESWFPDGTQLLADTYEPGGHGSMWTISVLGQSPRELHGGVAFAGGVSPDGTRIAFNPQPEASGDVREIWVMGIQADNPQKVLAVGENEVFDGVRWSPDGQRLAYIRVQRTSEGYQTSIETCSVKGENRTAIVSNSRQFLADFCWLPDGRVVYSKAEEEFVRYGSDHDNLWQIRVNGHAGTPIDKPRRITQWAGSNIDWLSAS